jgi:hypothetical protein
VQLRLDRVLIAMRCLLLATILSAPAAAASKYLPPAPIPVQVAAAHPRLVFRVSRSVEQLRALKQSDPTLRPILDRACIGAPGNNPAAAAACWLVTGEESFARAASNLLLSAPIRRSGNGAYSDVWAHALAFDWLYQQLDAEKRAQAAGRIAERLATELADLDSTGMALWHGRNQAANGAIIAALAIGDIPGQEQNLPRAAAHYVEALRALEFSEGWPEGPSYWIHNRALPYALAADCVITATGSDRIGGIAIRGVMRRIGLWTVYQLAPNGVFEPYGDSGFSLRPGEHGAWEASADYFARLSRDPGVMAGADWLRSRSPSPYGPRAIEWYAALAYDPAARPRDGYDPRRPELWMRANLPRAALFGRQSLGAAFFRGAWGDPDELYASFKAGDLLAHHDHYDAGHFSLQRGGLLAPITGPYGLGVYDGPYRTGYAIQTVSSNSLLILAPGETSRDLARAKAPGWTALSGGQRVIRATGFDCLSLDHFRDLLDSGPHLRRARITAFDSVPGEYDYIAADITPAYNSAVWAEPGAAAKVSLVTRQFVYLRREQAIVIHDRVEAAGPGFLPKFLLHHMARPEPGQERLLAGSGPGDGILETSARRLVTAYERGVLTHVVVLPEPARVLLIGGPNYRAYVESDGDQGNGFNGVNLDPGGTEQSRNSRPRGAWRTEVEPGASGTSHRFLNVLLPRLASDGSRLPEISHVAGDSGADAVTVGGALVVFARAAAPLNRVELSSRGAARFLLLDARAGAPYHAAGRRAGASAEGVLTGALPDGSRKLVIRLSGR